MQTIIKFPDVRKFRVFFMENTFKMIKERQLLDRCLFGLSPLPQVFQADINEYPNDQLGVLNKILNATQK